MIIKYQVSYVYPTNKAIQRPAFSAVRMFSRGKMFDAWLKKESKDK